MKKFLITMALSIFCVTNWATFTGLTLIPTSDYIGKDVWSIGGQACYTKFHTDQFLITEFGLGDRCEVGFDFYANPQQVEHREYFNFKYMVLKSDSHKFFVSVGFYNMMVTGNSVPFLVATKDLGLIRVHGGVQYEGLTDTKSNCMIGIDRIFTNG